MCKASRKAARLRTNQPPCVPSNPAPAPRVPSGGQYPSTPGRLFEVAAALIGELGAETLVGDMLEWGDDRRLFPPGDPATCAGNALRLFIGFLDTQAQNQGFSSWIAFSQLHDLAGLRQTDWVEIARIAFLVFGAAEKEGLSADEALAILAGAG